MSAPDHLGQLAGGAPFPPPAPAPTTHKLGFFDSLLRKDAPATPASGTPAVASTATTSGLASDKDAAVGGKAKKQAAGPTQEDLILLMDQISALSQSLADSQMAEKEAAAESARALALHDAMRVERDFMISKAESQEREMNKLREKVSFSALDATNEQLKAAKAEATTLQQESEALKQQNQILYQNYADINTELQALHELSESRAASLLQLESEKTAWEAERVALLRDRDESSRLTHSLQSDLSALQVQAASAHTALESARLAEAAAARDSLETRLAESEAQQHELTTDRNRLKKLADSLQTDFKKLMHAQTKKGADDNLLQQENQRLREDLTRKSTSLADALAALCADPSATPPPASVSTVLVAPPTTSVGGRDLAALQTLCNRLSETITEKEAMVTILRGQCRELGQRVLQLEEEARTTPPTDS